MVLDIASTARGVAIIGTIGVGKTSVAEALSEMLHEKALRHALIDVDWLGQVYPPIDDENPFSLDLAFRNLSLITPNFLDLGAQLFVIAVTLTTQEEMTALRAALPQVQLSVCLLTASSSTRRKRIESRDVGRLRDDFLQRTDMLDEQIRSQRLQDLEVENERPDPTASALELLARLRWETDA